MEYIEASIEINAPPAAVFAAISDLCRRARLNPNWVILDCEPLDGTMRLGARYRFVSRRGETRTEHVSRVAVYEPPWRLVLHSEVHPGLEIELTVHATPNGANLTHAESFDSLPASPKLPERERPKSSWTALRQWLMLEYAAFREASAEEARAALHAQIHREIQSWLVAIKRESERDASA